MSLAVAIVLALAGVLFTVSMFAPVNRTDAWDAGASAPASSRPDPPAGPSTASAAMAVAASPAASASRSTPAPAPARTTAAARTTPTTGSGAASYEDQVLTLVNQERAKAGCASLTRDSRLAGAAHAHSADMAANGYFDHTTPAGVTAAQRITNAGYSWSSMGENIAEGQATPASVMQAWMNSSGHRANILNCGFRNIGVGLAYDARRTPFWTQDFATAR